MSCRVITVRRVRRGDPGKPWLKACAWGRSPCRTIPSSWVDLEADAKRLAWNVCKRLGWPCKGVRVEGKKEDWLFIFDEPMDPRLRRMMEAERAKRDRRDARAERKLVLPTRGER